MAWLGGPAAPRFRPACPIGGGPNPRDRDPRAPAQALQGTPRRHRWRGDRRRAGRQQRRQRRRAGRRQRRRGPRRRPRGRAGGRRRRRPSPSGPRSPPPCPGARSRSGPSPSWLALPVWAYVYQGTLEPPPQPADTPIALGEELYKGCASCHGADGGGVSGPALTGRARDLAGLPRPHGLGPPRLVRLAGAAPTAPTTSRRRAACRRTRSSPTRSWPRSSSTSGPPSAAWPRTARSTPSSRRSPTARRRSTRSASAPCRERDGVAPEDVAP